MTIRKVRFVTPEWAYSGNNTSLFKHGGNIDESPAAPHGALDVDPITWWGAYVPLELWTPPKLRKSKFKGVVGLEDYPSFKKYNFDNKCLTDHEETDDPLTKREKVYQLCFNGHFDKVTNMLSDMYCIVSMHVATRVLPPKCTTDETDHDPYDCGWEEPGLGELSEDPNTCRLGHPIHDLGTADSSESAANAYDCGWDNPMPDSGITLVGESGHNWHNQYDCGWDDPMDHELIMEFSESAADAYDCGWDNPTDDKDIMSLGESGEDEYDCGWGDPMDTNPLPPASRCGDVLHNDESMGKDPYDCRWDDPELEPTLTGDEDMIDIVSSGVPAGAPGSTAGNECNVFQHAQNFTRCAIRQLRSIQDQDIHSSIDYMIPTTEGVCDPMPASTPVAIRGDTKEYGGAIDKVTELYEDIAAVHHLLNVHRRIMEQLDDMIVIHAQAT
ncbi:uncharacterized protein F5147DRAFT_781848 [Suillus discolor]|uniref:Uncharacterized protein n=1 Tax=Suillus discolor TaxID=1912936 RepID=A0A9P7ER37_9AGAM|nr:uncharacterized protein F5147DRAFT_781848 [Suillus discolor]KAG2085889.1 hypothetical protein F5147DRAFT_781848 [Suillus discolor]